MKLPNIGCIGNGFVGGSLANAFSDIVNVKIYDIDARRSTNTFREVIEQDILVVALPTPMNSNGSCNTDTIKRSLNTINLNVNKKKTVLLRSTLPPKFIRDNYKIWRKLDIVYIPEFLTEKNANLDFLQSSRFIFGTNRGRKVPKKVSFLFEKRFPRVRQIPMTWEAASLVKYATNFFLMAKVLTFNEIYEVCSNLKQNPMSIIEEVASDPRVGLSHYRVPGPDGDFGVGGHCLPKDINSFITFAKEAGIDPIIAEAVWNKNLKVRETRDWEYQVGRAVV